MSKFRISLAVALPAAALALGACQVYPASGGGSYRTTETVVDRSEPDRVYYYEGQDTTNVYYYETSRPTVIVNRHIYRENDGRTYYVERVGGSDRRYYYDDHAARNRHGRNLDQNHPYVQPRGATTYGSYDDSYHGTTVNFVLETSTPQRVHYRQTSDTTNVYYYDQRHPDVVVNSRVYREKDGRTFYVDRDAGKDRRFYFDDSAAKSRHPGKDKDDDRRNDGNGKGKDKDKDNGKDGGKGHK